jgi:hypothetical protein
MEVFMDIPDETKEWLLKSDKPYVRYNAKLMFKPDEADKDELLSDSFVKDNIANLRHWDEEAIERHNKPDLLLHRLSTIADLGVRKGYSPDVDRVIDMVLSSTTDEGIPLVKVNIPKAFGGSGEPVKAWILSNFPTMLYSLLKLGSKNETTQKAVNTLIDMVDDNGYRCKASLAKFRGPGRKADFCPYASITSAKALSEDEKGKASEAAKRAVEAILYHWEVRKEKKFFMFGIGTDFMKLKFPMVWYNLLHVLEVISRYEDYYSDQRFKEMVDVLLSKTDDTYKFKPESMYRVYKGEDFADKKAFSPTITMFAIRILLRLA